MTPLNANNFIAGTAPCVIHFWSSWCGPCITQEEILKKLEVEMPHVRFGKVNCEENPDVSSNCDIITVPTIILYKNGNPVKRLAGLQEENVIREMIKNL